MLPLCQSLGQPSRRRPASLATSMAACSQRESKHVLEEVRSVRQVADFQASAGTGLATDRCMQLCMSLVEYIAWLHGPVSAINSLLSCADLHRRHRCCAVAQGGLAALAPRLPLRALP